MKNFVVLLSLLTLSTQILASTEDVFEGLCTAKSKCDTKEVVTQLEETSLIKALPICKEVSKLSAGVKSVLFYDCRIVIETAKGMEGIKLKIKPYSVLTEMIQSGEAVEVKP